MKGSNARLCQSKGGVERSWSTLAWEARRFSICEGGATEWKISLEARTGWGEVTTYEVGALRCDLGDLNSDNVGLSLAQAKGLLAELQQRIVQTQIDEHIACARVCSD